jgi:hypothetical protein
MSDQCPPGQMKNDAGECVPMGGRRRSSRKTGRVVKGKTLKVKTIKRILKKAGLKVSGKKATLRARARKARLIRGGKEEGEESESDL